MALSGNYTPNIPLGTQQINSTQANIEINFQDIQNLFSVNHGPLTTVAAPSTTEGLHTLISYYNQTTDPATGSNDMALYAKPVGGDPNEMELFVRYANNGSVVQLTSTSSGTYSTTSGTVTTTGSTPSGQIYQEPSTGVYNGYQYIAGGIIMMFGYQMIWADSSIQTYTFPFPTFPNFSGFSATPFHMEMCHSNDAGSAQLEAPYGEIYIQPASATTYSITFYNSPYGGNPDVVSNYINYYWLAIGV